MTRSHDLISAPGASHLLRALRLVSWVAVSAGCGANELQGSGERDAVVSQPKDTGGMASGGSGGGIPAGGALFGSVRGGSSSGTAGAGGSSVQAAPIGGGSSSGAAGAGGSSTRAAPIGGGSNAGTGSGGSSPQASAGSGGEAEIAEGSASAGGSLEGGAGSVAGGGSGGGGSVGGQATADGITHGGATGGVAARGGAGGKGFPPGDGTCARPAPGSKGTNPLVADVFTADPAPLVVDCTFYITAGRDQGSSGFVLRDWYVLSSKDMVNWSSNGGPVLGLDTFEWANANAWAGQMVTRGGKFFWYVPINESGGGMTIAVAVADSPLGPYKDALGKPLVNDAFEMENFNFTDPGQTVYTIDPTVFVDEDEQAYLLYGGFSRLVVAKLGEDMISIAGKMVESTPRGFFEAPFLTKRQGIYYLVYAAGINPAAIDYVTAESPTGPWSSPKRILDPLPSLPGQDAATSHPGIAEFSGQWYLTYHLSDGPGGGTYRRQVSIEKLTFKPDGSIEKITPSSGISF